MGVDYQAQAPAMAGRSLLALFVLTLWAARLCAFVTLRNRDRSEDRRYQALRRAHSSGFRSQPVNRERVLDRGLWRYTRHPNYFGEACVWWGIYLLALGAGAWWALPSPMLVQLLLRLGGIELVERDIALRRPSYPDYARRTNAFWPGPPRRSGSRPA